MTKTINLVPKIDLLTRNCNLICSFMICVELSLSKMLVEKIVPVLDMDNFECTLQGF